MSNYSYSSLKLFRCILDGPNYVLCIYEDQYFLSSFPAFYYSHLEVKPIKRADPLGQ